MSEKKVTEGITVKKLFYADEIAARPKQLPKIKPEENEWNMAKMPYDVMPKAVAAE